MLSADYIFESILLQVSSIANELQLVQSKLKSVSESTGVPLNLKELSDDVLSFRNWIDNFNGTVAQLKASENHLEEEFQAFQLNLTSLKVITRLKLQL